MNILKKIIVVVVLAGLLLPPSGLLVPKKAEAGLPVSDILGFAQRAYNWAQPYLKVAVKELLLKKFLNGLITSIESGEPMSFDSVARKGGMVTNWEDFLKGAGDIAFDNVLQKYKLKDFFCSPFNLQLQIVLPKPGKYQIDYNICTIDSATKNLERFFSDFQTGDWLTYSNMLMPRNNIYGSTIMAMDEVSSARAAGEEAAKNEAISGQGYAGALKCTGSTKKSGETDKDWKLRSIKEGTYKCDLSSAGSIVGEAAKKAYVGANLDSTIMGIMSKDEWAGYAALLVDALVNRIGTELIAGTKQAIRGDVGAGCGNISDPNLKALCEQTNEDANSTLAQSIEIFKQDVHRSLDPRVQADTVFNSLISPQKTLVDNLTALTNKSDCAQDINIIDDETNAVKIIGVDELLTQEKYFLDQLTRDSDKNAGLMNTLQSALDNLEDTTLYTVDRMKLYSSTTTQAALDENAAQSVLLNIQEKEKGYSKHIGNISPTVLAAMGACGIAPALPPTPEVCDLPTYKQACLDIRSTNIYKFGRGKLVFYNAVKNELDIRTQVREKNGLALEGDAGQRQLWEAQYNSDGSIRAIVSDRAASFSLDLLSLAGQTNIKLPLGVTTVNKNIAVFYSEEMARTILLQDRYNYNWSIMNVLTAARDAIDAIGDSSEADTMIAEFKKTLDSSPPYGSFDPDVKIVKPALNGEASSDLTKATDYQAFVNDRVRLLVPGWVMTKGIWNSVYTYNSISKKYVLRTTIFGDINLVRNFARRNNLSSIISDGGL